MRYFFTGRITKENDLFTIRIPFNVLLEKLREETEIPEIVYQKAEQAFKQIHILTPETDLPAKKRT